MKNIIGILVVVLLVSTTINAQGQKNNSKKRANLTSEQTADLQTKRMALHFDLDKNQQKAVYNLNKKQAEKRMANAEKFKQNRGNGIQLTAEQRFEVQNNRLENQIETKTALKKILNKEQFEKWEKHQKIKLRDDKKRMAKVKNNNKDKRNRQDGSSRKSQLNKS